MPAIIAADDCQTWLSNSDGAIKLLKPYEETMAISIAQDITDILNN
jgi:putative SOS response-associated peptidase YedK